MKKSVFPSALQRGGPQERLQPLRIGVSAVAPEFARAEVVPFDASTLAPPIPSRPVVAP